MVKSKKANGRRSTAVALRQEDDEGRLACVFCHQPGLLEHEMPMDDETREEMNILSRKQGNDEEAAEELTNNPKYKRPRYIKEDIEMKYGLWFPDKNAKDGDDISCHSQCLISSPALFARDFEGGDEKGVPRDQWEELTIGGIGITREDVKAEVRRARSLKCFFCGQNGASIGCTEQGCSKSYHYPCGKDGGFIFVTDNKTNPSYCWKHMTKRFRHNLSRGQPKYCLDVEFNVSKDKKVSLGKKQEYKRPKNGKNVSTEAQDFDYMKMIEDFIESSKGMSSQQIKDHIEIELKSDVSFFSCQCCLDYFDELQSIVVCKCCKFANFHRDCLSRMGIKNGLCGLNCPLCQDSNRSRFIKSAIAQGVYAPNREALIELDGNFDDQYVGNREKVCTKSDCKFPKLQGFDGTMEEVILCDFCGSNGLHIGCDQNLLDTFKMEEEERKTKPKYKATYDYACEVCILIGYDKGDPRLALAAPKPVEINVLNLSSSGSAITGIPHAAEDEVEAIDLTLSDEENMPTERKRKADFDGNSRKKQRLASDGNKTMTQFFNKK